MCVSRYDVTTTPYPYQYGDPRPYTTPFVVGIGDAEVLRAYERELNRPAMPFSPRANCDHCFCDESMIVNDKPHQSCCMCATRRVKVTVS